MHPSIKIQPTIHLLYLQMRFAGAKSIYSFVAVDELITPFAKCQNHADAGKEKVVMVLKS